MDWNPHRIAAPTLEEIRKAVPDTERMMLATLDAILDRFEADPAYPFIDTKLSLITGENFPYDGDPERNFRGKGVVYCWIQGRGLEAMVGHAAWLQTCSLLDDSARHDRRERIAALLRDVVRSMEQIRERNNGRLFFMVRPDGTPLTVDDDGRLVETGIPEGSNYGDLFYAKGLLAAADFLGMPEKVEAAKAVMKALLAHVESNRHTNTAPAFDPKNKTAPIPGRHSHGPRMIMLGAMSLYHGVTGEACWLDTAEAFVRYIFSHHLNLDSFDELQPLDYVEFIDDAAQPWHEDDGDILCDPGHALEMVGFAAKLLPALAVGTGSQRKLANDCRALLPKIFEHILSLGWNPEGRGICKAFGLVSRKPINADMPWWNLPETIRAGALLLGETEPDAHGPLLAGIADTLNALLQDYVNPRAHLMAYQTRNAAGEPIDVIPSCPEADPAYHTGLSLIDALAALREV